MGTPLTTATGSGSAAGGDASVGPGLASGFATSAANAIPLINSVEVRPSMVKKDLYLDIMNISK